MMSDNDTIKTGFSTAEETSRAAAVPAGPTAEAATAPTLAELYAEPVPAAVPAEPAKEKPKKKKKLPPKVVTLEGVGMRFRLTEQKVDNLKEYFIRLVKRKLNYHEFWALKDVTFHVRRGWRVGILGLNAAVEDPFRLAPANRLCLRSSQAF